ncbi:hypothetical protein [Amnibacterium endophyticum]|uniref:Uncharacterized protein n=1 Tax=Amnibacterium endophyticum TaxID=2109337 RepID=A0ABW4LJY6_9MICO
MPEPRPLPDDLAGRPFDRAALVERRRSKGRATRKDLVHPLHGVHSSVAPTTLLERCRAYAVRMRPGRSFCHATAAQLRGMPLPVRLQQSDPLHVAAVRPASPPRTRGVIGHRLSLPPVVQDLDGLVVCAPSEAWVQLGDELDLDELVEIADHLLTVSPLDPGASAADSIRNAAGRRRRDEVSHSAADSHPLARQVPAANPRYVTE